MIVDLSEYQLPDEALLRERPSEILLDPSAICSMIDFDVETTGLWPDAGDTVAAVGVAYRLNDREIEYHSFAFDQGRAEDKGFAVQLLADTPTNRRAGAVGLPAGDPFNHWDWDTDYNLPEDEWRYLCTWLREAGKACGINNHNLKFDIGMMRKGTRHWAGIELEKFASWDTMLANPWVWPKAGTNALKPIAAIHWGEEATAEAQVVKVALAEVRKRYGLIPSVHGPRYDLLPWATNGPYVASDAALALRLAEVQLQRVSEGYALGYKLDKQVSLLRVLSRMERRGFGPYDVEQSREIADRIDAHIEKLKADLPFEPTGAKAASYFYDQLGLAPWKTELGESPRTWETQNDTRKGMPLGATRRKLVTQGDCSKAVALRMAEAGVPHAQAWAQITELTIANQMFYRNYADLAGPDHKLRPSYKQAHVRSGRLSTEHWQAQGLVKKLGLYLDGELLPEPRSLFGVDPGRRRMNLDLGQAELRIGALLAGCDVMSEALASGDDFHGQTTRKIFHDMHEKHAEWDTYRDIGKRSTFLSLFLGGAQKFRETLWDDVAIEWSLAEAKRTIGAWRNAYPEFQAAYYKWMHFAERTSYVPIIDGTPSWLAGPRDFANTAWNRHVQSSLAAFNTDWLILIEKHTARYHALILNVHDSAVLDLPEDRADEICAELKAMSEALWFQWFKIPGVVDVKDWYKPKELVTT